MDGTSNDRGLLRFPKGFLWGVSTSSHQVEGGNQNNNWSAWEEQGRIRTGERAGRACGWWENAEQDFDRAKDLGLNALRFSVEWSRVEPEDGRFDERALARYREMAQGLLDRGIRPFVCLHHFTNPLWFEARGAFLAEDAVARFALYVERVAEALGDLVTDWVTFNEPNVYVAMGYVLGEFPPGHRGDFLAALEATVTLLRAHGRAYEILHRRVAGAQVGFTQNLQVFQPESPHLADRFLSSFADVTFNDSFLRGVDPSQTLDPFHLAFRGAGHARGLFDFVGFNHYGWMNVAFDRNRRSDAFIRLETPRGMRTGDPGQHATYGGFDPAGLARISERLARLGKPLYVLEHGVADKEDRVRPWLLARAAAQLHQVIGKGVDLRGYFHWTLVDNFEWAEGWGLRFGLFELDVATGARTARKSAHLYGAIARANGLDPAELDRHLEPGEAQAVFAEGVTG